MMNTMDRITCEEANLDVVIKPPFHSLPFPPVSTSNDDIYVGLLNQGYLGHMDRAISQPLTYSK